MFLLMIMMNFVYMNCCRKFYMLNIMCLVWFV